MSRASEYSRQLDELYMLPITPEDPAKVRGPEVGTRVRVTSTYDWLDGQIAIVTDRSYVWSPDRRNGATRGFRRYDWSVIKYGAGKTLVVDDAQLVELPA